uniref:uncharacterized protein zgc:193726 isoform X2 n=1 Tax=Solea senegalensis TaxID=28829 RepID=UPI001CD84056|nr:uncharacterized protein zgc:193726 isoform X2 [Solea senegalensis]
MRTMMMRMKMKSVAPRLMMMMMVVVCVSAGPLPLFRSDYSNSTNVPQQKQENVTRLDDLQPNENITGDILYDVEHSFAPMCILPSCALANLGHSLQTGDETAGSFTRDPYSYGKK